MDGSPEEGTKLKSVDENGYEKLKCVESCFERRRLYFLQPMKRKDFNLLQEILWEFALCFTI